MFVHFKIFRFNFKILLCNKYSWKSVWWSTSIYFVKQTSKRIFIQIKKQKAVYSVMWWFTCWNFYMLINILKASFMSVPTCPQGIWKLCPVLLQPFELPAPFTWHFFRRQPFDQPQKSRFPASQSDWLTERASWDAINQQFLWITLNLKTDIDNYECYSNSSSSSWNSPKHAACE